MEQDMENQRCDKCRYWKEIGKETGDGGECKRYPPKQWDFVTIAGAICYEHFRHPETDSDDWCGEFKREKGGNQWQPISD